MGRPMALGERVDALCGAAQFTAESVCSGNVSACQYRCAPVKAILDKLRFPPAGHNHIPLSATTCSVARELVLALSGEMAHVDKKSIETIKKIRALSQGLIGENKGLFPVSSLSGISADISRAIWEIANSENITEQPPAGRGRPRKEKAKRVAQCFAIHYPVLTGCKVGTAVEHDFVRTLGYIFEALGINANAQHVATQLKPRAGE